MSTQDTGLRGVAAAASAVCLADQDRLLYRGYAIEELAEKATFEEVAYLLLYGELPGEDALERMLDNLLRHGTLAPPVLDALQAVPVHVPPADVLQSMLSFAAHFDPVAGEDDEAVRQRAQWLLAQAAAIFAARRRLLDGEEPVAPRAGIGHAAQLLYQSQGELPEDDAAELLDLTLVLCAEHELNPATFASRVICSTGSDLTAAVVGGIAAMKGPLHGGEIERAMQMLLRFDTPEEAGEWTRKAAAQGEHIAGFGNSIYQHGDHRAEILERKMRKLAHRMKAERWLGIYDAVADLMRREHKLYPNLELPCAVTYHLLGLPMNLYTPLLILARIAGWGAHYLEQRRAGVIIRPSSAYTGKAQRSVPPIDER